LTQRSPWLPRVLLGIGALAVIATVISIAVGEEGPDAPENEGFNEVQKLLGGIHQEGALLGDDDAPVLVKVFNDLNCLPCARYQVEEVDPVIERYARSGDAQFEFSHFSLGPQPITESAIAASAAGEQARQWQYIDLLIRNLDAAYGDADPEFLTDVARAVPELEIEQWEEDRLTPEVKEIVEADAAEAVDLELQGDGDAAVIVTGPGGEERLEGAPSAEEIEAAVESVQ
jgi:protein-disulfide isomerase